MPLLSNGTDECYLLITLKLKEQWGNFSIVCLRKTNYRYTAIESLKLPYGGKNYIGCLFKYNLQIIEKGADELYGNCMPSADRARLPGGGRKKLIETVCGTNGLFFEVDAAYQNRVVIGNKWTGTTPSGVKVEGYLNPKTTVYPKL